MYEVQGIHYNFFYNTQSNNAIINASQKLRINLLEPAWTYLKFLLFHRKSNVTYRITIIIILAWARPSNNLYNHILLMKRQRGGEQSAVRSVHAIERDGKTLVLHSITATNPANKLSCVNQSIHTTYI